MDGKFRHSYRDRIAKKWKDFKIVDGGIPSVINVLINAFKDANVLDKAIIKNIFKRVYTITLPHWILDYKSNGAFPEAIGIISGLNPIKNKQFFLLGFFDRAAIFLRYIFLSFFALITPSSLFKKYKNRLYKFFKR
jgi:hypothetical protein